MRIKCKQQTGKTYPQFIYLKKDLYPEYRMNSQNSII